MEESTYFTSDRERRLWLWALAAVVAIWSTVGLAGSLAQALRQHHLLGVAFFAGYLITLGAIGAGSLSRRPNGRELWVMLGVAAVYGMVIVRMGVSLEERSHLFEYGLVAVLIHKALRERRLGGRHIPALPAVGIGITAILGWIDEGIQAVLPHRVYDPRDVLFNTLAAAMAVAACVVLERVRK